jgi:hypothetical protein
MDKKRTRKEVGVVETTTKIKGIVTHTQSKQLIIPVVSYSDKNPANVSVGGKVTKNMGNYESVTISVNITIPCDPNDKAIETAYNYASDFIDRATVDQLNLTTFSD